jgi:hypothetical protein
VGTGSHYNGDHRFFGVLSTSWARCRARMSRMNTPQYVEIGLDVLIAFVAY